MSKLDKNFFDFGDLIKTEWNRLIKEEQNRVNIYFDLENNDSISQKRITIDTPEDEFENSSGDILFNKARFKCELCLAGGDWQHSTYYFCCQGYKGVMAGRDRFVLIPNKEQGNIHLVDNLKGNLIPQDSNLDLKRNFSEEEKLCWEFLPDMLKDYLDRERDRVKRIAMRLASDTELEYGKYTYGW